MMGVDYICIYTFITTLERKPKTKYLTKGEGEDGDEIKYRIVF